MKTEVIVDSKKVTEDKLDFWLFEIQVRPSRYVIERRYALESTSVYYQVKIITK